MNPAIGVLFTSASSGALLAGAGEGVTSTSSRRQKSRLVARLPLLHDPAVDGFDVEPPVAAHVKGRDLTMFQQPVDRGRMHLQIS